MVRLTDNYDDDDDNEAGEDDDHDHDRSHIRNHDHGSDDDKNHDNYLMLREHDEEDSGNLMMRVTEMMVLAIVL